MVLLTAMEYLREEVLDNVESISREQEVKPKRACKLSQEIEFKVTCSPILAFLGEFAE